MPCFLNLNSTAVFSTQPFKFLTRILEFYLVGSCWKIYFSLHNRKYHFKCKNSQKIFFDFHIINELASERILPALFNILHLTSFVVIQCLVPVSSINLECRIGECQFLWVSCVKWSLRFWKLWNEVTKK